MESITTYFGEVYTEIASMQWSSILLVWSIGLVFSLFLGKLVVRKVMGHLQKMVREKEIADMEILKIEEVSEVDKIDKEGYLATKVGYFERLLFTICVAFNVSGVFIGAFAWVGLKALTHQKIRLNDKSSDYAIGMAITSLVGSLVSILMAIIGGLFISRVLGY